MIIYEILPCLSLYIPNVLTATLSSLVEVQLQLYLFLMLISSPNVSPTFLCSYLFIILLCNLQKDGNKITVNK